MKKLIPKGIPDKLLKLRLTAAEKGRYRAFCKLVGMNYSEAFRSMSNMVINAELKKRGTTLKCEDPEIIFSKKKTDRQLELWR